MKATGQSFHRLNRNAIERDVAAELECHLDLLTREYLQKGMPSVEAKVAALKQFGNVERIADQCAEIRRRRRPLVLIAKVLLSIIFLTGILIRILAGDFHLKRCGDLLSAVSFLSWVLLYVRLHTSLFLLEDKASSPLKLTDQTSFAVYDQKRRTPVERIISR
jgi:hypothetical protein